MSQGSLRYGGGTERFCVWGRSEKSQGIPNTVPAMAPSAQLTESEPFVQPWARCVVMRQTSTWFVNIETVPNFSANFIFFSVMLMYFFSFFIHTHIFWRLGSFFTLYLKHYLS